MIPILLIVWLLVEVAAIIAVAHVLGILLCVLLLIAGWPVGTWLMRAEGRAVLRRVRETLATGAPPTAGAGEAAVGLLAGPLFIIPGFVTDLLGLALLVPAVRHHLATRIARRARGRVGGRGGGFSSGAWRPYDVDGSAHETSPPPGFENPQLHG